MNILVFSHDFSLTKSGPFNHHKSENIDENYSLNENWHGALTSLVKYLLPRYTVCPRSSDPFYIVSYYIKWVTTSWTDSIVSHLRKPNWQIGIPCYITSVPEKPFLYWKYMQDFNLYLFPLFFDKAIVQQFTEYCINSFFVNIVNVHCTTIYLLFY